MRIGSTPWPRLCDGRPGGLRPRRRVVARSQKLLAVQPKLRAKGAGRVVELLLRDDAVSPAPAAKAARLSDRAAGVCSIGWSSLAPCANSLAGRIFGSMDCSVFARRKRVKKGM